ncbi:MAG: nonstructural protein [Microvirus sp.]|nr:MAG: nonstructural protein [Microvirus sp.]
MRLKMYSIRDSKAECFNQPFFCKTHGEAERNFLELTKDEKSFVSKYSDDYDLYFVGEYDDQTGTLESLDAPLHIVKAALLTQSNTTQ